jgi:hypothetical protein
MSWCSARCCRRTSCSPMRQPCRCSTLGGARQKPGGSGAMRSMIGLGPDPRSRRRPTSTPRIAEASIRPSTWWHSKARCRLMAMPDSASWSKRAKMLHSGWHSAGRMRGGRSTSSILPLNRRSRPRCWHASPNSTPSRPISEVNPRICVRRFVSSEVGRWSKICISGCRTACRACRAGRIWPKPCGMYCVIGTD